MATGAEWSCPICREAPGTIAYVGSCLHQFCHSCILRWARKNPSCPLCRQPVHTIIYPAPPDQNFVEMAVPQSSMPRSAGLLQVPGAAGSQPRPDVAGFDAETWARFFRTHTEILQPLELWLNEVLWGACWWDVAFAQGRIMASLCHFGLHEEALAWELEPILREQTPAFVRQLIEVAADQCAELARRLMDAAPQQSSPGDVAVPGTSAAQEPGVELGQAGAGASRAGQSGGCAPRGSPQSERRSGGGPQNSRAAGKRRCRRQD